MPSICGPPKEFRPKLKEGVLKSAISAESRKQPKEPKETERRYFGKRKVFLPKDLEIFSCRKRLISAKIGHFGRNADFCRKPKESPFG